jgi:glycosyltransferase involved in cell wall biosynthesis
MMSPTANPLVSMIVLCYNQAQFVVETLESVKSQTYTPTQLIIVDDCSTDGSVAVIEQWLKDNGIDCTFIRHQQNYGLCKTVNDAVTAATGKYVSMVASDDIWLPDKIARQVEIMEAQPGYVGVLYSDAFQIDEHGNPLPDMFVTAHRKLPEMPQGQILDILIEGNFIPAMTTLIRRSCYEKVGLYDEKLPWEDWDMWLRLAHHYSFLFSPIPSARYRRHEKSLSSSDQTVMFKGSFKVLLKHFNPGNLNEDQKSKLIESLLWLSEELYRRRDNESSEMLLAAWRATGNKRARWMYRFAKLGVSYRIWRRAYGFRLRLKRRRDISGGSF